MSFTESPPITATDSDWCESMMQEIARCAPFVVRAFGGLDSALPAGVDRETLAGQVILRTAELACREGWSCNDFESRAEATVMECIAAEYDGIWDVQSRPSLGSATPERRVAVLRALDQLGDLRLQVLALIVQEALTIAEAAVVLDLPEWRVHQECAQAVGQIRRQVCGTAAQATAWLGADVTAGGESR